MDKRVGFTGGEIGITNTELDLMPNSNREGLEATVLGLATVNDLILSGINAVIDPGVDVTISPGWIFLNGEVLQVDAQVVPDTAGNDFYIFNKVVTANDPAFDRDYRDGSSNNVAEIQRGIAVSVVAIGGDLSVDGDTLGDVLKNDIRVQSDFTETDSNEPSFIQNKPIIPNVVNTGSFVGLQVDGDPIGTFYSVTGDIVTAEKTANQGQTDFITITLTNAMADTNYLVRSSPKSGGAASHFEDTHLNGIVFRPISTTVFILGIRESGNVAQNLGIIMEVVQL